MKTRVIRYWHEIGWLHKVEKWALASDPPGTAVRWDWHHVEGCLSEERARELAEHVAKYPTPEPSSIVAEYVG